METVRSPQVKRVGWVLAYLHPSVWVLLCGVYRGRGQRWGAGVNHFWEHYQVPTQHPRHGRGVAWQCLSGNTGRRTQRAHQNQALLHHLVLVSCDDALVQAPPMRAGSIDRSGCLCNFCETTSSTVLTAVVGGGEECDEVPPQIARMPSMTHSCARMRSWRSLFWQKSITRSGCTPRSPAPSRTQ